MYKNFFFLFFLFYLFSCINGIQPLVNYSNPNDTYTASADVKMGAQMTDVSILDPLFPTKVIEKPILLAVLGFFSITIVDIALCCGCTKQCAPSPGHAHSVKGPLIALYVLLFLCFVTTHVIYYGYTTLGSGIGLVTGGLDDISDAFGEVEDIAFNMQGDVIRAKFLFDQDTSQSSDVNTALIDCLSAVSDYYDSVKLVSDAAEATSDIIQVFFDTYIALAMFAMYAFLMIGILGYLLSALCQMKGYTAAFFGHITLYVVFVCGVIWMLFTAIIASLCYPNPTENLAKAWTGVGRDLILYYSSCSQGRQWLWEYAPAIKTACQNTIDEINSSPTESSESYYVDIEYKLNMTIGNATLSSSATSIEFCREMQAAWFQIFNDGICGDVYSGVRNAWIAQISSSVFLFFIVIVGSIVSRHFTPNAKIYNEQGSEEAQKEADKEREQAREQAIEMKEEINEGHI
eukprot:TRINITY_DN28879_c0_g1_i1.p1 TRINITY_DN28879_c0_g1~~TRINITY_DN28879_c0_g1_i1.p1  ORF type:complete len:460 (-),score=1.65 TRINITY_DN28879_c0_g1_i1:143-1522(-)